MLEQFAESLVRTEAKESPHLGVVVQAAVHALLGQAVDVHVSDRSDSDAPRKVAHQTHLAKHVT